MSLYYSVRIPWSDTPTMWHPTSRTGPMSVLTRGAFKTQGEAHEWARKHLRSEPYDIATFESAPASNPRKRKSRKRGSRRNPPPLYRAVGIDASGRRVPLGAGPLAGLRQSTMATWLGDPSLKSAYVVDAAGHSYLSLEPRDRRSLSANTRRKRKRTSRKKPRTSRGRR